MAIMRAFSLKQLFNTGIRLVSLAAKLGLTLYMGRYFGLADIGIYGLVFGAVMILSDFMGFRLDYIVSRTIVGTAPSDTLGAMRDQAVFMLLNHLALAIIMLVLSLTAITGVEPKILFIIYVLSVVENFASATQDNMTSLERPILANFLFFIRAASWVLPVIALGYLSPSFRNIDVVFICWTFGVLASLILTVWFWRYLPWSEIRRRPVHWDWIKAGVRKSFFIWLGTLGLTVGMYVDRFIVLDFLGLDKVGIATFYFSFTFALLTLSQSGVLAFAYPRLIKLHRNENKKGFRYEARQAGFHTAVFAAVIAIGIGIGVPLIGIIFQRPELAQEAKTLWLMLAGTWIRANAETFYYILFARDEDRPIWLGNLFFLIFACGFNVLFVPLFGFIGIGYSTIMAALFLLIWRGWFVFHSGVRCQQNKFYESN